MDISEYLTLPFPLTVSNTLGPLYGSIWYDPLRRRWWALFRLPLPRVNSRWEYGLLADGLNGVHRLWRGGPSKVLLYCEPKVWKLIKGSVCGDAQWASPQTQPFTLYTHSFTAFYPVYCVAGGDPCLIDYLQVVHILCENSLLAKVIWTGFATCDAMDRNICCYWAGLKC